MSPIKILLCSATAFAVSAWAANAQNPHSSKGHAQNGVSAPVASPYVAFAKRQVKALSDGEIAELRSGKGMGLALAAELNGYPGPLHVLELSDQLTLSKEQREQTQRFLSDMRAETTAIGERIITEETKLDRLFGDKTITKTLLNSTVTKISLARGELRAAHLRYHLSISDILTPAQIKRYLELRGYH